MGPTEAAGPSRPERRFGGAVTVMRDACPMTHHDVTMTAHAAGERYRKMSKSPHNLRKRTTFALDFGFHFYQAPSKTDCGVTCSRYFVYDRRAKATEGPIQCLN
jgi:hypothetical protein